MGLQPTDGAIPLVDSPKDLIMLLPASPQADLPNPRSRDPPADMKGAEQVDTALNGELIRMEA